MQKIIRNPITWLVACALVASLGVAGAFLKRQGSSVSISPKRGPIVEAVYGLGTVTATHVFRLKVGVTTGVKVLHVREGDMVKQGDPLVTFTEGPVFRSAIAGTVTAVPYKVGEMVFPSTPIVTVVDLKDNYVEVALEQQGALRIEKGQSAILSFESLRGQKFTGKVRTIFPSEGQFLAHIDVDEMPSSILPGMTADVAIEVGKKEDALLIPVNAISAGKIVVLRDGRKSKMTVKIGTVDGEWAEVLDGDLKGSDLIVTKVR